MSVKLFGAVVSQRGFSSLPPSRLSGRLVSASIASLLMAGTAIVPVSAQVLDLGGVTVSRSELVTGGPFTVITNGTLQFTPNAPNAPHIFGGQLTDGANPFALIKLGTGSLTLTGTSNDFTGATRIENGQLIAGATNTLSPNSLLQPVSLGIVELNGFSQTVAGLDGGGNIRNSADALATLTLNGTSNQSYTGGLNGNLQLVKNGAARQSLGGSGANTYTGGTILNAGTLRYLKDSAFGTGTITVNGPATLEAFSTPTTITNAVILNANATFLQNEDSTFTGLISGSGTLTKTGMARLTLTNTNTYAGGTVLNGSRLGVGASGALGTGALTLTANSRLVDLGTAPITLANNIIANNNLSIDLSSAGRTLTLSGNISGTSQIIIDANDGVLALTGNNSSHSGGFLATRGSFAVGSSTAFGAGTVLMGVNSVGINAIADDLVIANTILLRNTSRIDTGDNTLTFSGLLTNATGFTGGLDKRGTGTLILGGTALYTENTQVTEGTLQVDGLLTGDVSVGSGATLAGAGVIAGTVVVADGASLSPGNSPGTMVVGGLDLNPLSTLNFELSTPGVVGLGINDLIVVINDLTLDGTINVNVLPGFQFGTFTIMTYGGTLTDNGLLTNSLVPEIQFTLVDPATTPGTIQLDASFVGTSLFWDGGTASSIGDGIIQGGDGTWSDTLGNWTIASGNTNLSWVSGVDAVFGGTAGEVTVVGGKDVGNIDFTVGGYTLSGDAITLVNASSTITVDNGTAIINNQLAGPANVTKSGAGTLDLGGNNSFAGDFALDQGIVRIRQNASLGAGSVSMADGTTLELAINGVNMSRPLAITGTGTILVDGSITGTLSGPVTGDTLVKAGTGRLILGSALNTMAAINIDGGTLTLGDDGASGTGLITMAGGTTLAAGSGGVSITNAIDISGNSTFDSGPASFELGGVISGPGALRKIGTGTLALLVGNSYDGDTIVEAGTLALGNSGAASGGEIRLLNGTTLSLSSTVAPINDIFLGNGGTIIVGGENGLSGVISGTGPLLYAGEAGNTISVTGVNSYSGGTRIEDVVVSINADSGLGALDGQLALDAGTLRTTSSFTTARALQLDAGGGVLSVDDGTTLVVTGDINGTGALTKADTGTLVLQGENGFSGGLDINAGTLAVNSADALGTGAISISTPARLRFDADMTVVNAINGIGSGYGIDTQGNDVVLEGSVSGGGIDKFGIGRLTLSNALNDQPGNILIIEGELRVLGGVQGNIALDADTMLSGTGTITGSITSSDPAGLVTIAPGAESGQAGTLTTGSLVLGAGSILAFDLGQIGVEGGGINDLLQVNGDVSLGGTLNVNPLAGFNIGVGAFRLINYTGALLNGVLDLGAGLGTPPIDVVYAIDIDTPGQVNLNVSYVGEYNWDGAGDPEDGTITGGDGTLSLAGTNWTNSDGSFNLAWGNVAGAGGTVANFNAPGGEIDLIDDVNFRQLNFNAAGYTITGGSLNMDGGIIATSGGETVINATLTGTGGLIKSGTGGLILNGDNSYTGGTLLLAGAITAGTDTALGVDTLTMEGGTALRAGVAGLVIANNINLQGSATIDNLGNGLTLSGTISGSGPLNISNSPGANLAAVLTLTGVNSYSAGTVVNGTSVRVSEDANLGAGTGFLTLNQGRLNTTASFTSTRTVQFGGAFGQLDVDDGTTLTLDGLVAGPGELQKLGTGTLILGNGFNTYGGDTVITDGTVSIGADGALGLGNIRFEGNGGTLALTAGITSTRNITLNAEGTINTLNGDSTISGLIQGEGALRKTGPEMLTLTGVNTYEGGTFLDAGALRISNGSAIGTGTLTTQGGTTFVAGLSTLQTITLENAIVFDGGTTIIDLVGNFGVVDSLTGSVLTNGTALTLNGLISGEGGWRTQADTAGTVFINNTNSYEGGTELTATGVFIGADDALGTGLVTLNSFAAVQNDSGAALSLSNDFQINAAPSFSAVLGGNSDLTLSGSIDGAGRLSKAGDGTLTVTGTSGFAGVFDVNEGSFVVATGAEFGGADLVSNVRNGATLSGTGTVIGTVNMANAAILSPGNSPGTLTIDGNLNLSASTDLLWELGEAYALGGASNDRVIVTGNLVLDGRLTVTGGDGFGLGVYNLFSYGTLTDNGLTVQTLPGGFSGFVQNNTVASQINLIVTMPGTFIQYWDGADQVGDGNINGGDGVWSATAFNWTGDEPSELNTSWQPNSVGIFTGEAGTVQVVDDFTFQGLIFEVDGYTLANAGGSLEIGLPSSFIVTDAGVTTTIGALLTGEGQLLKQGAGNLVLNGDNNYSGGTALTAGTIVVGTDTALGTGTLTMSDLTTLSAGEDGITLANDIVTLGAGLMASNGFEFTLDGDISGAGSLSHVTAGNLVLNGNNSFDGLGINVGTVTLGSDTAGGIGDIAINNLATLAVNKNVTIANDVQTTATGIIASNGFTFTINGDVSGAGSISHVTAGNLVLNGDNSFDGLGINVGTVTLGSNTAAGIGDIAINNLATLAVNKNVTIANDVQTTDTGIIASNGFTFTINGDVSGAGSISHVTAGNLVLNGDNSFDGLGINVGTVTLGSDTAAGIGDIAINNLATLAVNKDVTIANDVQTTDTGIIASNGFTFTINGDVSGAGSLSHVTAGNLVLNGNNSFDGLGINVGTVTLGSNTAAGIGDIAINNLATLAVNKDVTIANSVQTTDTGIIASNGFTFTINGDISDAGSLSHVTAGNLVLNGNNSFDGLGINVGTVTLGSDTAAGIGDIAINNLATLAVNKDVTIANSVQTTDTGIIASNGFTFTINGDISDAGSLSHVTAGNLVLNGDNSFTNLGINVGTVTLGSNTAAGIGAIAINNLATLAVNKNVTIANSVQTTDTGIIASNGFTFTINGDVSGAGSLSHVTAGNLVLNGNNSFTNLGINVGRVTVGTNTAAGIGSISINNLATLAAGANNLNLSNLIATTDSGFIDTGAFNFTLSGAISGAGSLTKIGSGRLFLTGTSSYTGATTVAAGDLRVTGSIGSSVVTVQSGARLSGTGTVGGIIAQSGSVVAPGNSVGTLNVSGPVTFQAGSTYAVDVTPAGADRITATGALSLAGTMAVAPTGTFTTFNQTFTVLSGSSRTGTFGSVTGLSGFGVPFNAQVDYTATSVAIRLAPASLVTLAGTPIAPNALEVARAFDRAVAGGYNPQAFFNLYTQGANMRNALGQLSGEIHAAERRVAMEDTRVIRETAFDRLNAGLSALGGSTQTASTSSNDAETTVWLRGVGSWGVAQADGTGSRFTTEQLGVLTGLDYAKDGFKIGAAFTYTQNDIEMAALGNARVKSTGGALYAGYRGMGGFSVGVGGSVAGTRSTSNRAITAPGLAQALRGSVDGTTYQLFGELAYDIAAGAKAQVTPFARYAYVNHRANAFGETGGIAAVNGTRNSTDISVVTAGVRAGFDLGNGHSLVGSAGWQNITGDRNGNAVLALTGVNQPMNIQAVGLDKNSAALEAKANFKVGSNASLGLGYSGIIGDKNSDHGARATLTIGF